MDWRESRAPSIFEEPNPAGERIEALVRDSVRRRFLGVLPTLRPEVGVWIVVAVAVVLAVLFRDAALEGGRVSLAEWAARAWRAWLHALGLWDSPYRQEQEAFKNAVLGPIALPPVLAFLVAGWAYPFLALAGRAPRGRLLVTAQVVVSSLTVFGALAVAAAEHSLAARYAEADASLSQWPLAVLACATLVECLVVATGLVVCVHDPTLHRALLTDERVDLRLLGFCGALVLACAVSAQAGFISWPTAALVAFNGAIALAAARRREPREAARSVDLGPPAG